MLCCRSARSSQLVNSSARMGAGLKSVASFFGSMMVDVRQTEFTMPTAAQEAVFVRRVKPTNVELV